ncbi:hypothetical protein BJ684DRAFT_8556 [Piptocephalis cylindrospora]|uniref:Methylenetetrahydrofolate dehydrogenase n=1 Tax=Piptocephalis cylindrospora TaxID=1907219 RepID=A0A4P9Y8Z3_9FUNG|nr:hypothetical protein BJ684DRAFT_8556 [Piptocephalis cylindrospora]|eukprot:RKP14460.1 hypothetical protein BJ684DRAFT_8556 [Piptocephalis cylindrospora]
MPCKTLLAGTIAAPFRSELKEEIAKSGIAPLLVGFLANEDPAARKYAEWTAKTCEETGVRFELRECPRERLEEKVVEANEDPKVNGIMVYYPVFGDRQDQYLQNVVSTSKDVEGLTHKYVYNMYHNIRYLDEAESRKCIVPCTPLACIKVLEHLSVYNAVLPYGNRLHGRTIVIVNRSEVVGRPLAALLANDGARVLSVDVNDVKEFHRGPGISLSRHEVTETDYQLADVLPLADVIITGVPSPSFKIRTEALKDGVVAVNFSTAKNFNDDIKSRASLYVPSVGKVTVAMLQRNLLRLYAYQQEESSSKA